MTFDEWFATFFAGMIHVPDYVLGTYHAAYRAGYTQGAQDTQTLLQQAPLAVQEGTGNGD